MLPTCFKIHVCLKVNMYTSFLEFLLQVLEMNPSRFSTSIALVMRLKQKAAGGPVQVAQLLY